MHDRDGPIDGDRLSPRAFRTRLRALSPAEFRRFVAALWAARGRTTAIDGRAVVARRPDGTARRLLVVARPHSWGALAGVRTAAADAVVCPAAGAPVRAFASAVGADVYDAESLRRQLLYGVSPEDRDRLLQSFFDATALGRWEPRPDDSVADGSRADPRDAFAVRLAVVAVVAIAVALLAGGLELAGGSVDGSPYSAEAEIDAAGEAVDSRSAGTNSATVAVTGRTVDWRTLAAAERETANATPACGRSPEAVVQHHLVALRSGTRNDTAAQTRQFVHPDAEEIGPYGDAGRLLERPAYAPLREYETVTFDFVRWGDGTPSQRVAVTTPDGTRAIYRFDLAAYERGVYQCWGLTGVEQVG